MSCVVKYIVNSKWIQMMDYNTSHYRIVFQSELTTIVT